MAIKTGGGNGSYEGEGSAEIMAEINITPLTDIFLVLLIIFMVTSSVMSQMGVEVKLPQATQQTSSSQPDGVILTLLPNGDMRVNQEKVAAKDFAGMKRLLTQAFSQAKSRLVVLEGDRDALLGNAIEVMDEARKAGAERFAIATAGK